MLPDPGVDRLGTDVRRPAFEVPSLRDLVGAPALPQLPDHERMEGRSLDDPCSPSIRLLAAASRVVLGDVRGIGEVGRRVLLQFPRDGAAMDTEFAGNLRLALLRAEAMTNDDAPVAREVDVGHDEEGGGNRCGNADDLTPLLRGALKPISLRSMGFRMRDLQGEVDVALRVGRWGRGSRERFESYFPRKEVFIW